METINSKVQSIFDKKFGYPTFDHEKQEFPWLFELIKSALETAYDAGSADGWAECYQQLKENGEIN